MSNDSKVQKFAFLGAAALAGAVGTLGLSFLFRKSKPTGKTSKLAETHAKDAMIEKIFKKFDTNNSLTLDANEVKTLVADLISQLQGAEVASDDGFVGMGYLFGHDDSPEEKSGAAKVQQSIAADPTAAEKSLFTFLDTNHDGSIDLDEFTSGYKLWMSTKMDEVLGFGANTALEAAQIKKATEQRRRPTQQLKEALATSRAAAAANARKVSELQVQLGHLQKVHAKDLRKAKREAYVRLTFAKHDSNKDQKLDQNEIAAMVTELLSNVANGKDSALACMSTMFASDPECKEAKIATENAAADVKANVAAAVTSFVSTLDKDKNGAVDADEFVAGYDKWVKTKLAGLSDDRYESGAFATKNVTAGL